MTDKTKYKSVAIDYDCYKKIEELSLSLTPGVTLSRAQVIRMLVDKESKKLNGKSKSISKSS